MIPKLLLYLSLCFCCTTAAVFRKRHVRVTTDNYFSDSEVNEYENSNYWMELGRDEIYNGLSRLASINENSAKNVVVFVGDGMSFPTITSARIYKMQKNRPELKNRPEAGYLTFERFDNVGLTKTYAIDQQIVDSAASASALFSGVKTKQSTLGYDSLIEHDDVYSSLEANEVTTVLTWAQEAGMDTGIVTTARMTHATPAALYAHSFHRDYECDSKFPGISNEPEPPEGVHDIAHQLINRSPGNRTKVLMGGGHAAFLPQAKKESYVAKEGYEDWDCYRVDNEDLVQKWLDMHERSEFVDTRQKLNGVDASNTDYLLGLFAQSHVQYDDLRDEEDPSLVDMVKKALEILKRGDNGFFLMVEGARIDHAHHDVQANRAINEAVTMDLAVEALLQDLTYEEQQETLIIVTADHSHTMSIAGYTNRGTPIDGLSTSLLDDDLPYTTLGYSNGQAFYYHHILDETGSNITRRNISEDDVSSFDYEQNSAGYRKSETHGGDDVPVFAQGPFAHLFHSTHEQTFVAHVMAYSACIGPYHQEGERCEGLPRTSGDSSGHQQRPLVFLLLSVLLISSSL